MPTAIKTHRPACLGPRVMRDHARYDATRRDDPVRRVRSTAKYQRFIAWFVARHPLCADPFQHHRRDGITQPTQQVHHVVAVRSDPKLLTMEGNCRALCTACHALIEGLERRGHDTKTMLDAILN